MERKHQQTGKLPQKIQDRGDSLATLSSYNVRASKCSVQSQSRFYLPIIGDHSIEKVTMDQQHPFSA